MNKDYPWSEPSDGDIELLTKFFGEGLVGKECSKPVGARARIVDSNKTTTKLGSPPKF